MYYSNIKMKFGKRSRLCIFLFTAVTAAVFFQSTSFATSLNDQAKEFREKGFTAQLSGDIDSAAMFYQKAIDTYPSFAAAYNDLGVLSEMRDNLEAAEADYLKAAELDNSYLATYSNLAYLYEKKGDFLKAATYWKKRIENGSADDSWTLKAKDNLKRLSKVSPAVKEMLLRDDAAKLSVQISQQKINEFKQRVILTKEHFDKGQALYNKKEFVLALEEFRLAKKISPDDKKIDEAIEKATRALIDLKVSQYSANGLKYYSGGDYNSARNEFKKLLAIIPAPSDKKSK